MSTKNIFAGFGVRSGFVNLIYTELMKREFVSYADVLALYCGRPKGYYDKIACKSEPGYGELKKAFPDVLKVLKKACPGCIKDNGQNKGNAFFRLIIWMFQKHCLSLQQKITMTEKDKYYKDIAKAVKFFWNTKKTQLSASSDKSNRGAVVGGKQMDAFVGLIKQVAIDAGVPDSCIYTKNNYLPGFFRSSKDWDLLIISPSKKLIAAIELKSQIGSYGNNFNNRTEEVLGSAVDLWTAFRENQFPNQQAPWVGYFIVVGKDKKSTTPVKNNESHYSVRPEFKTATYIDRYRILCQKLILERHYTSVALLCTSDAKTFEDVADDVSIHSLLNSFSGYLKGLADEFK